MSVLKRGLRKSKKLLFTDEENRVRKATASEAPEASQSLLGQIANDSYNIVRYDGMYSMLWKRLSDNLIPSHVYKALLLIEYLLQNGDSRLVRDIRRDKMAIVALQKFETADVLAQRTSENIRVQATVVLSLLENSDVLSAVRTKTNGEDLEYDYQKPDTKASKTIVRKKVKSARSLSTSSPSAKLSITSDEEEEEDTAKLSAKKIKPKKKKAPRSADHQSLTPTSLKEARRHKSKSRKTEAPSPDVKAVTEAKRAARKIKKKKAVRVKKQPIVELERTPVQSPVDSILDTSVSEPIRESTEQAPLASSIPAEHFDDFDSELMGDYDRSPPSPAKQPIFTPSSEPHVRSKPKETEKSQVGGLGLEDFALFASVHESVRTRGDNDLVTGFETVRDRWEEGAVSDTSSDEDAFETDDDEVAVRKPSKSEEKIDLPGIDLLDMENLAGPANVSVKKQPKSNGTTLKVIEEKNKSEKAEAETAANQRLSHPPMQGDISEMHVSPASYIIRGEGRAVKADQYGLPVHKKIDEPEAAVAAYPINWHKF